MVRNLYLLVFTVVLLFSCGTEQPADQLFFNYYGKEVPPCFEDFQGMGREVFPDFLSWGVFKYTASYDCLKMEYLEDASFQHSDTLKNGEIIKDEKIQITECNYFPNDLSFYQEAIDKGLLIEQYDCDNKIYLYGIKHPYVHEILYDTISHSVVHLVGVIRD